MFKKYLLIGVANTFLGYAIIVSLIYIGVLPEVSNFLGYACGLVLSYILNKKYCFESNDRHSVAVPKYMISMGICYLLNMLVLLVVYRFYGIDVYVSQFFASCVYVIFGYFLNRNWVFRGVIR